MGPAVSEKKIKMFTTIEDDNTPDDDPLQLYKIWGHLYNPYGILNFSLTNNKVKIDIQRL